MFRITSTQKVSVGDQVNLISDFELENQLLNSVSKRNIEIKITAKENQEISANINLNEKEIVVKGPICMPAKNAPLTIEELQNNFNKNEYFNPSIIAEIENVFIPKQQLNEFRRNVYSLIIEELTKLKNNKILKKNIKKPAKNTKILQNFEIIENLNTKFNEENIIYSPSEYIENDIKTFIKKCKK